MTFTAADYQFLLYNPLVASGGALKVFSELNPVDVIATWKRSDVNGGSFEITLPFNESGSGRRYTRTDLVLHSFLEIRRNNVQEFVGVIESVEFIGDQRQWIISGPDLTSYYLGMRIVGATAAYVPNAPAETVIKNRVENLLGPSAAAAQRIYTNLAAIPFTVVADQARGGTVTVPGQRQSLQQMSALWCKDGDVLPAITLAADYTALTFDATLPTDKTIATGSVPFSVDWDNVESIRMKESTLEYKNDLYVNGDGSGDTRNQTEVSDAGMVGVHGRREGVVDARYATTAPQRTDVGTYELALRKQQLVAVQAVPLRTSASAQYRTDWDVGYTVTFSEPNLRADSVDIRIVGATVSLTRQDGEKALFELGQQNQDSTLRRMGEALRRLQVAAVA